MEKQQKNQKEKDYLAESTEKETSPMFEAAKSVRFDNVSGRITTGRVDPMTNDVFDPNSNSSENENSDDAMGSYLCDAALFKGNYCGHKNED